MGADRPRVSAGGALAAGHRDYEKTCNRSRIRRRDRVVLD